MKNRAAMYTVAGFLIAVIAIALFVKNFMPKPVSTEGSKTVTVKIDGGSAMTFTYTVHTDGKYLIDVMNEMKESEMFTFETQDSQYGAYVTSINGKEADSSHYWAIYVNDDYGQYGISEQPVNDGDAYAFVYEQQ